MITGQLQNDRAAALAQVPVSRETAERFDRLVEVLGLWQAAKNLVGPNELAHIWTRHIADSAQLHAFAPNAERWLDFGSGAGFPGLILGIMLAEHGKGEIVLIEANARKCAFLREAVQVTGARAHVRQGRLEDVVQEYVGQLDVVTARAVAPLPRLLEWTKDLLRTGTVAIFPKGQDVEAELTAASKSWKVTLDQYPSLTNLAGRILVVRSLALRDRP